MSQLAIGCLLGLLTACEDFIAEDVSQEVITLNTPAPGVSIERADITFWWEPLEVKTSYRLQVVTPSFEQAASLVLDTLVTTHQLDMTLASGPYTWRVRAENGTYRGAFSEARSFTVIHETVDPDPATDEPTPDETDGVLPFEQK